jgi:hypothetical protein
VHLKEHEMSQNRTIRISEFIARQNVSFYYGYYIKYYVHDDSNCDGDDAHKVQPILWFLWTSISMVLLMGGTE